MEQISESEQQVQPRPESKLSIPVRLRNLKDAIPATWRELASLFDMHEKTVLRWASGQTYPSFENIRRLRQLEDGLKRMDGGQSKSNGT